MGYQEDIRFKIEQYEGTQDPFVVESLRNTARAMVEEAAKVKPGQKVLLWFDEAGMQLVQQVNLACIAKGAEVKYYRRDVAQDAEQLQGLSSDQVEQLFAQERELMDWSEMVIIVRDDQAKQDLIEVDPELRGQYEIEYARTHSRRLKDIAAGGVDWCLFLWPSRYEAEREGLDYEEYFRLYMEACNQPWGGNQRSAKGVKSKVG